MISDRQRLRQQVDAAVNAAQASGNAAQADAAQRLRQAWDALAAELETSTPSSSTNSCPTSTTPDNNTRSYTTAS